EDGRECREGGTAVLHANAGHTCGHVLPHDGDRTTAHGVGRVRRAIRLRTLQGDEDVARRHRTRVVRDAGHRRVEGGWGQARDVDGEQAAYAGEEGAERLRLHCASSRLRPDSRTGSRESRTRHTSPGTTGAATAMLWLTTWPCPWRRASRPSSASSFTASRALNPDRSGMPPCSATCAAARAGRSITGTGDTRDSCPWRTTISGGRRSMFGGMAR